MNGTAAGWLSRLGKCGVRDSEGEQCDAHSRNEPHRDSHGGDRRSGMGPDAGPAQMPDRRRGLREPYRFCAPDYPSAIGDRILSRGGTATQHLLPKFRGERGQRQQARKRDRTQRAPSVTGAGLAFLDVPNDQVARLLGQLAIPVGQQLSEHRAGLPPGKRDVQCTEGFLQPAAST